MSAPIQDSLTEREFQLISDLVYRHCGINLHDGKKDLVRARLAKCIRNTGASSVANYLDMVRSDASGREFASLIDAISTNLTSFFRESAHFDFLRGKFLPALIDKKRKKGSSRIRAWSAGCSTGEEPYSLAMTLLDVVEDRKLADIKVLATDISRVVLRRARGGVYEKSRMTSVPPAMRTKFLQSCVYEDKPAISVVPTVKQAVVFNYLNLIDTWPFKGPFDFIFCRNVMIYFDKQTQERLVNRFWECLEPGGVLFTGHSESLTGVSHKFQYVLPTVYAR